MRSQVKDMVMWNIYDSMMYVYPELKGMEYNEFCIKLDQFINDARKHQGEENVRTKEQQQRV